LRHQYGGDWYLEPLSWAAYAVALAGVAVAVWRWRGERTVLIAVGLAFPLLFAVPANSYFTDEPRYAMTLLPILALGSAYAANRVRWQATVPLVLALAATGSVISLQHVVDTTSDDFLVLRPPPTDEIWEYLDARDVDIVYAEYWLAYRLVWEDRLDVTVLPISSDYYSLAQAHPEGAAVALFYRSTGGAERWAERVDRAGMPGRTVTTPTYQIVETPRPLPVDAIGDFPAG
jgi:hypothetical protein